MRVCTALVTAVVIIAVISTAYFFISYAVVYRSIPWKINSNRDMVTYIKPESSTFHITPKRDICAIRSNRNDTKPLLLIVVCSAVKHFEQRQVIRQTWASDSFNRTLLPYAVRIVFLLGKSVNDPLLQRKIENESFKEGDIIQEDFIDTYYNLTIKAIMMLKWTKTKCPQAKFLMKADDDMFINTRTLTRYLSQPDIQQRKDLIVGYLYCGTSPIKDWRNKWYCPPFMYNETLYPDYTCGTAYVISGSLVPLLLKTAMTVPLFHLEDVYVTGILAKQLNVTPENHHLFSSNKYPIGNPCLYREIISSHGLSPLELRKVWKAINDPLLNCTNVSLPKFPRQDLKTCPN